HELREHAGSLDSLRLVAPHSVGMIPAARRRACPGRPRRSQDQQFSHLTTHSPACGGSGANEAPDPRLCRRWRMPSETFGVGLAVATLVDVASARLVVG